MRQIMCNLGIGFVILICYYRLGMFEKQGLNGGKLLCLKEKNSQKRRR